jgi:hypothetical protein
MPSLRSFVALSVFFATPLLAAQLAAQTAQPVESGATTGYELALTGAMTTERGTALRLFGIGYEVTGFATLAARSGLAVDATLTAREGSGYERRTVSRANVRTGNDGRFEIAIDVPDEVLSAPAIELVLHRTGQPGRRFTYPLGSIDREQIDLLADRNRYEPGERVRSWTRVRTVRSLAPAAGRGVRLTLLDPSGQELASHEGETTASGVITADLTLPRTATAGHYRVVAQVTDGPRAEIGVQVWERTVERLLAEVEIDGADEDDVTLVAPGGRLRGRVWARTPSGTPVRGANIELRVRSDAQPTQLVSGDDGSAPFDVRAPAFLSGDVGTQSLVARVVHPAHGTVVASATYLMARVAAVASATARGGALVPEVPGTIFVSVSDPRGRPVRSGTAVAVRGEGIRNGLFEGAVDARGFVEVPITLPRGAASTLPQGPCAGQIATTVEVEIRIDPPVFARVCARVAADAEVAAWVVGAPVVAPGSTVELEIARRPSSNGRPVLLEALWNGRAVAYAWAAGNERRASIALPNDLLGEMRIRARATRPTDITAPPEQRGLNGFSVGSFDAVLVRPADTFQLTVSPRAERYLVRERAVVELSSSTASQAPAWGALLVRDEAAHGGEGPWELYFLAEQLHRAVWQPANEANARMIRVALAAGIAVDPEPVRPAPLELPYWEPHRYYGGYHPDVEASRGVLRDPIALRQEMLRRGLGPIEQNLELAIEQMGNDPAARARITQSTGGRVRFHPDVVQNQIAARVLSDSTARTLGGQSITVAMIEASDSGFSFDTAARRVTRRRLARLLLALSRLTDPENPSAQRVSSQLPPDRWLGTLVQLSMVQAHDLTDAWGNPFVFRAVTGRRPRLAVSERALTWELASGGPDGRIGTGDDMNDPFARAVPEGTPYAVSSGEEELIRRFGTLAPSALVLTRMSQAYDRLSLAASEEQREGPVSAASSETADEDVRFAEPEPEEPLAGLDFAGDSAEEGGRGRRPGRAGGMPMEAPPPPMLQAPMPAARAEMMGEQRQLAQNAPADQPDRGSALGALIREDFPATLFFAGEVALDARGRAEIEVPLADALTTYRLEAIAWTASGWTTSNIARLRVDQRALVDAPVPSFATVGDRMRMPVRVENRTDEALPVTIEVRAEGELAIDIPAPVTVEVPARSAHESIVEIVLRGAGEGALVVSAARPGGEGLDAVRRPILVLADARTARERRLELIDGEGTIELDIPREATERGPGQLTLSVGARLFGDPAESVGDPLLAGWTLAMAGEPLPDALAESIAQWVTYEDHDGEYLREPGPSAHALSALWNDRGRRMTDNDARRALRAVGQHLPGPEAQRDMPIEAYGMDPAWLLLHLAPVALNLDARPGVRADAERVIQRLRRLVSTAGARATDSPDTWALCAAALALSGESTRASELLRRTQRYVVRVGDTAWVEPEAPEGEEPRARPSALAALAHLALNERTPALALVRGLVDMHADATFSGSDRAYASAAAARLASGAGAIEATVEVDGQRVRVERQGAISVAPLAHTGRPGQHRIRITLPRSAVALARVELSYGMPWDVAPRRRAPIDVTIDGEIGARDTRSATLVTVRNRGARILTRPIVELELPAGSELDEPTRAALAGLLRADARQEGRTLILPLRTMAPGGWVRLPLPARWAVGGTLRGLGAVAYDDVGPEHSPVLAVSVLPSRGVEIEDRGAEAEPPDPESSPPPLPIRPPIPILERLAPGGAR